MTAIDELCRLLDERGEPYIRHGDDMVTWRYYTDPHSAIDTLDGTLQVTGLTPEQAIAATLGAGTIDKAAERIEVLSGFAREYLHRYGYLMNAAGEDVTDEVWAIEQVINEVCGAKVVEE